MKLSNAIVQVPRAFDADRGNSVAALFADVPREVFDLIAGTAGCSLYLARLLEKETQWLCTAIEDMDAAVETEIAATGNLQPDELSSGLRRAKRRIALITALADLAGAWPLERVTGVLTDLADAACQAALSAALRTQISRGKLPGMTQTDVEDSAGMVVFAMGKMGAGELNYSSDIDLICLFDETRFDPDQYAQARAAFARATRAMTATLSEITAEGYVFRTDLRLRPDPSVTPVCIAMEAAENYYESLGRTWERAAYIKARPAAGDKVAGARFLKTLTPFVWRRHLDFAAIQDAHDMRLAIRQHKGLGGPITLAGHNMKLGRGGIREIEFFTQTRQLIAGGRDPDLRSPGTVPGLHSLADKGWVTQDVASELAAHYTAHRTVEHRLQMMRDAQTHSLPKTEDGFARLAAMMDTERDALHKDLRARLEAVHEMTEGFFAPAQSDPTTGDPDFDDALLHRWVKYPALRSARSRQVFERVKPELLTRLSQTAKPAEAILAFDGFLSGLPAGVQLFSLLEANPSLTDLIIDITGTSPALAQYLSRNAGVFDAVIAGDFFSDWPGQAGLEDMLSQILSREVDYERQLDATRLWFKEWRFRIGVHLLRGLSSAQIASTQYSDLARSILSVLWPLVCTTFARKHGDPPGRGAIVLGLGSLGAGVMTAASDLDLIVIYDPLDQDVSTGQKPLSSRLYYARLTQALITALSAPMAQGKLFEVDMRLRPSGNQGPVATSWPAFQSYQRDEAWLWEHLALTRACVVAGPAALTQDVSDFRTDLLSGPRDLTQVMTDVATMCERIRAARAPYGLWDVKIGPGRLQEIDLIAQAGALMEGEIRATLPAGLQSAHAAGLINQEDAVTLTAAAGLFTDVFTAIRLLSDKPVKDDDTLGTAAQAFLVQTLGQPSMVALEATLLDSYARCDAIVTASLAPYARSGEAS